MAKNVTKADRAEREQHREQMQVNADRTRRLAEKGQAELDRRAKDSATPEA